MARSSWHDELRTACPDALLLRSQLFIRLGFSGARHLSPGQSRIVCQLLRGTSLRVFTFSTRRKSLCSVIKTPKFLLHHYSKGGLQQYHKALSQAKKKLSRAPLGNRSDTLFRQILQVLQVGVELIYKFSKSRYL